MTNKFTRTGVSQPRFPDSSAMTMPPFSVPLANLGEDAAVLALPKESSVWNGSPCDRDGSDYATASGLASPNGEYEYSAPLHPASALEVNFLGIQG